MPRVLRPPLSYYETPRSILVTASTTCSCTSLVDNWYLADTTAAVTSYDTYRALQSWTSASYQLESWHRTALVVDTGTTEDNCFAWGPPPVVQEEQNAVVPVETPAELRARLDVYANATARVNAAREKARTLLLKLLTTEQKDQLEKLRYFEVIAGASRRRYRIREGIAGNIRLVDPEGREVTQYCCHPAGLPIEDVMVAQKLQIEHDEEEFLRLANASPIPVSGAQYARRA